MYGSPMAGARGAPRSGLPGARNQLKITEPLPAVMRVSR
jgi:hypothetical protein